MAKSYQQIAEYPSASSPGKVYTVSVDEEGSLSCNCPAWTFKKRDVRTCKHVQDYERNGEPVKPAPVPVQQTTSREKGGTLTDLFDKLEKGGL